MRIEKIPLFLVFALILAAAPVRAADDTYSVDEITAKATGFFGDTTAGLAKALEKVFADHGRPNAYITGEEISGAIGESHRVVFCGKLKRKKAVVFVFNYDVPKAAVVAHRN